MAAQDIKMSNVPNLRFPGFEGEWEEKKMGEVFTIFNGYAFSSSDSTDVGIPWVKIADVGIQEMRRENLSFLPESFRTKHAKFILNKGELVIALTRPILNGKLKIARIDGFFDGSFLNQRVGKIQTSNSHGFVYSYLQKNQVIKAIENNIAGSDPPNLSPSEINNISLFIPAYLEQNKIGDLLSRIDCRIETQNKIIKELKVLKTTVRGKLFNQVINKENEIIKIKNILEYEQPTKYLVLSTDYSFDSSLIPVLTANKAFILGYTHEHLGVYNKGECIIFDDFTMDLKYVEFPFKVKSSAIKILKTKTANLKFIFEYLCHLNLRSNEHKRHYISEIEAIDLSIPNEKMQDDVAKTLSIIDKKLEVEASSLKLFNKQKQYLLKNLFI